jgi:hypothetical protein
LLWIEVFVKVWYLSKRSIGSGIPNTTLIPNFYLAWNKNIVYCNWR